MITQERLKEVLSYDESTGDFISLKAMKGRRKGSVCGGLDKDGYIQTRIDGRLYRAHRLVFLYMTGSFPDKYVDHINHNRRDNRWCNLREVGHQENRKNSKLNKNNKSGFPGVRYCHDRNAWRSEICVDGKNKFIGRYLTYDEAVKARIFAQHEHGFHNNHGRR